MAQGAHQARFVRVLPDLAAVDRVFDYLVPEEMAGELGPGTRVRVPLGARRVDGWVLGEGLGPPEGAAVRPVASSKGWGPPPEVVELAGWAAWRWAGRRAHFLATGSPSRVVRRLPGPVARRPTPGTGRSELAREAISAGRSVVRLPPSDDPYRLVEELVEQLLADRGLLVLVPSQGSAGMLAARLEEHGLPVAVLPEQWAAAAAGGRVVVGTRSAAWAPMRGIDGAVVIDAHDESYAEQRAPTWNAWVVASERAARSDSPCVLTSPCPTLELLAWGTLVSVSRRAERAGWPVLQVIDRRDEDPRAGLISSRLVPLLRSATSEEQVVCVLNRKGRARLLACSSCREVLRCEQCTGPLAEAEPGTLRCLRCGAGRPLVCASCGSRRARIVKAGVSRVREELEALVSAPVAEVTGSSGPGTPREPVVVGTEAVLHRLGRAAAVVFLDIDSELLATTYQAHERALALLCRAARLVGGRLDPDRSGPGRLVVQTRLAAHEVLDAALHADPGRLATAEEPLRRRLGLPPFSSLARVSGPGAGELIESLRSGGAGIEAMHGADQRWLVRAPDHRRLCDALARAGRPAGRVRVEVDPLRA